MFEVIVLIEMAIGTGMHVAARIISHNVEKERDAEIENIKRAIAALKKRNG